MRSRTQRQLLRFVVGRFTLTYRRAFAAAQRAENFPLIDPKKEKAEEEEERETD